MERMTVYQMGVSELIQEVRELREAVNKLKSDHSYLEGLHWQQQKQQRADHEEFNKSLYNLREELGELKAFKALVVQNQPKWFR